MSDKIDVIVQKAAEKAVEIIISKAYQDVAHPGLSSFGQILSYLPRTVQAWLAPWEKYILIQESNMAQFKKTLQDKINKIPENKFTEPEPYVAIPALQQLCYCLDSEALRDMYGQLIASSMDRDKKEYVHPAFVDIIKQLNPDEAKLIKSFKIGRNYPLVDIIKQVTDVTDSYTIEKNNYSNIAYGICEYPQNIAAYLENLDRLGIISIGSDAHSLHNTTLYDGILSMPDIQLLLQKGCIDTKKFFSITEFGNSFIRCVCEA